MSHGLFYRYRRHLADDERREVGCELRLDENQQVSFTIRHGASVFTCDLQYHDVQRITELLHEMQSTPAWKEWKDHSYDYDSPF